MSAGIRLAVAAALSSLSLALVGCGKTERPRTTASPQAHAAVSAAPPSVAPPTAPPSLDLPQGVRVYIDLSNSMVGFPLGGPNALESVHRQVLQALAANGLPTAEYCELGKAAAPVCGLPANPTKYKERIYYKGTTSPLATVLETPAPDPSVAQRPKAAIFGQRLTVILTDGLESGSPLTGPQAPGTAIPGPNVFRLRDAFKDRISDGFGAWVLTISLPFNGRVIPERGLGQELFKRAQAHLQVVATDPVYAGIRIEAKDLVKEPKDKTEHYQYLGPRPLLLMVFSQDVALGRAFVDSLKTGLKVERVAQPADMLESVELAPSDVQGFVFNGISSTLARGERSDFMRIAERREGGGLVGRYECRGPAAGRIELAAFVSRNAAVKLPAGLKQTLDAKATASPPAPGLVSAPAALGKGRFAVEIDCSKVTQNTTIEVELSSAVVAGNAASGWWHRWSAPNSYEMPEKVFGLTDFVDGVLGAQTRPPVRQDVARLIIEKKG